ncbi:MAG: hypothetical protein IPJ79_05255 [Bacteroidetes bacterium]|nr:hypothetical protein [Bacteroidota bacterium]
MTLGINLSDIITGIVTPILLFVFGYLIGRINQMRENYQKRRDVRNYIVSCEHVVNSNIAIQSQHFESYAKQILTFNGIDALIIDFRIIPFDKITEFNYLDLTKSLANEIAGNRLNAAILLDLFIHICKEINLKIEYVKNRVEFLESELGSIRAATENFYFALKNNFLYKDVTYLQSIKSFTDDLENTISAISPEKRFNLIYCGKEVNDLKALLARKDELGNGCDFEFDTKVFNYVKNVEIFMKKCEEYSNEFYSYKRELDTFIGVNDAFRIYFDSIIHLNSLIFEFHKLNFWKKGSYDKNYTILIDKLKSLSVL